MPELNTNELAALAEVCSNIVPNTALPSPLLGPNHPSLGGTSLTSSTAITMTTDLGNNPSIATPMPNVLMNSLVSPTKIITDDIVHPMLANVSLPEKLPVACLPPPVSVIEGEESSSSSSVVLPAMDEDPVVVATEAVEETAEESPAEEAIEVEEDIPLIDEEPMDECAAGSPKQPASLKSEDVVMAENFSVRRIISLGHLLR